MTDAGGQEEDARKTLMQLEVGRKQLEAMTRQAHAIEQAVLEMDSTIQALKTLDEASSDNEILVPLGSNTFVKAVLKDKDDILVGVGAGVSLEKPRIEAVKTLESRREEYSKKQAELREAALNLGRQVEQLNILAESNLQQMQQK